MFHTSKKIIVISIICVLALGGVIYAKVQPYFSHKYGQNSGNISGSSPSVTEQKINYIQQQMQNSEPISSSTSITSNLTRNFAQNLVTLQQNGQLNDQTEAKLIQNFSSAYATSSSISFGTSDIVTFSDLDKEKVHTFGNAAAKIIISYSPALKNSPIDILNQDQQASSTATFQATLKPMANAYRAMALALLKVPAPVSQAANYLAIVNGYVALGDDVDNMSYYFSDSVRGFIGISNYQQDFVHQINLLKTIADYFKSNAILFTSTDEGNIWSSLEQ